MYKPNASPLEDVAQETKNILQMVEQLRNILISVSTGGPPIGYVNADYKECYFTLTKQLNDRGLQNPVPYQDLWDWYGKWSSGDLPTYRSRREYIRGLLGPIEARLREGPSQRDAEVFPSPTGWPLVDRKLNQAREQLASSSIEEEFQAVGLFCRETLISLAQTVFDPDSHPPLDDVQPSETDAKRMLDSYLAAEMGGQSNATVRKHARAALDLANELQHQQTATFRKAAICAQATASVVNIVAILSGIRDPNAGSSEP